MLEGGAEVDDIPEENMTDKRQGNTDQNMEKVTNPCRGSLTTCNTGVGAEVDIPEENMDDNRKCNTEQNDIRTGNTDQNMDGDSSAGSDSLASDDVVMTTGHTYMVTKVALASDLESETGAEDLDSLIQAVKKTRNSTTKETVKTNQGLTDRVMVT